MKKVLVGLSGGVDSAIAAALLKEQGYDVTCCFMRNWDSLTNNDIAGNPDIGNDVCPQESDYQDAKAVAEHLGLPLLRKDFIQEYWDYVFQAFLKEYEAGRTPNPDILCNKYIKFDAFFDFAKEKGFDTIAMGHYASNMQDPESGYVYLTRAADTNKDQTYFLAQIPQEALSHTLFPLGNLVKPEVRAKARELELDSVSSKKDSTGICFIGERNFRQFLSNYLPAKAGDIIDIDTGCLLGRHQGVLYYTIGQRKGLNITGFAGPWFVAGKDVKTNRLFVSRTDHKEWLDSTSCLVTGINWLVPDLKEVPEDITVKFRYRQPDQKVSIEILDDNQAILRYPQKIASVTAGQEAVLYNQEKCLGGGVIDQVWIDDEDLNEKILQTGTRNHENWLAEEQKKQAEQAARNRNKKKHHHKSSSADHTNGSGQSRSFSQENSDPSADCPVQKEVSHG